MRLESVHNLKKGAQVLRVINDPKTITDDQPAKALRAHLHAILPRNKMAKLAGYMEKSDIDYEKFRWLEYDKRYHTINRNIRHIFKSLTLTTNTQKKNANLFNAVTYLQKYFKSNQRIMKDYPTDFMPKCLKKYLFSKLGKSALINPKRYEILLYRMLKNKIGSSDIFISDSLEYRSLESYLIEITYFTNNMTTICANLGTPFLVEDFEERFKKKLKVLDNLIHEVNQNILNNKNPYIKFKKNDPKRKWHLEYKGVENKEVNNPIFKKIPKIDLANLIWLVNKKTHFFNAFTHILKKNTSLEIDSEYLIAVIIAYATNMGLQKMASCSGLSYNKLKKMSDSYFREETLKLANEMIINKTNKLPIQKIYKINNVIHSSVDGKKYDAPKNVFNSRYSSKYFGLGTGISVLTLVANFQPVGLKIISPSEYEGNYNLELLLMNETDMQPQINSTDMHGITDINHALHDYCGYDFQPCYTNIYKQAQHICCSKDSGDFPDNYAIKPTQKINEDLYLEEEFNIKRIVASILSKTGTVSTIVKKLNYSLKINKTRKAIAEDNKVLKSIHILKTINSLQYRQNMRVALNRGESYHFLTGAVGYANGGKIMAKTEQEQLLFKECTRLVCNIILYYNSYILSQFYIEKLKTGQHKQVEALKRISPIAWINVNLYGKYDLNNFSSHTSLNKLFDLIKNESLIDDALDEEDFDDFEASDDV